MDGNVFKYKTSPHPRGKANIFSILTFSWMLPLFYKGTKKKLGPKDLYEPLADHKAENQGNLMESAWTAEIERARTKRTRPSYFRALWSVYGKPIICQGVIIFVLEFVVRLSQPFFLGGLIKYIGTGDENDLVKAYLCAAGLIGSAILTAFLMHTYHMNIILVGMNMRLGTCSLLYRKILDMRGAEGKVAKGRIVNLMGTDSLRFDFAVTCVHDLWIAPVQSVLIAYFLYQIVGLVSAAVGMATIFVWAPLQVWMGKITSEFREKTAVKSDARVNLMNEVVHGIQVIKMHGWEDHAIRLVKKTRMAEMSVIKRMAVVRGVMTSFQMYHTRTATALTILTNVLLGYTLTAYKVFMLTSFFGVLGTTFAVFFPLGVLLVSECIASVRRVEEFLVEQLPKFPRSNEPSADGIQMLVTGLDSNSIGQNDTLVLDRVASKWHQEQAELTISGISMTASKGKLNIVIGPVGSGKTSLLLTILGELYATGGTISGPLNCSYCPQEPWLFPSSIRKNILFGEAFEKEKYQNVIGGCALQRDIECLKYNDHTKIGERGVTLSGGQKARVNLARSVYKDADVYLLDDPLSAVDNKVRSHILDKCIRPLAQKKIVILVTHSLDVLTDDDHVVHLRKGRIADDLSTDDLRNLDDSGFEMSAELCHGSSSTIDDYRAVPRTKTENLTASVASLASEPSLSDIIERKKKKKTPVRQYIDAGGILATIVMVSFVLAQIFASASDYWVSLWVNLEENNYTTTGLSNAIICTLPFNVNRNFCLRIFGILILITFFVAVARSLLFFFASVKAANRLHKKMYIAVIKARMNFHYSTKSGSIMSRFSNDQGTVDEQLPVALMDFLQIGLAAVGIFVVIPATNAWLLIPTLLVLVIFYGMRVVFVRTTSGLREIVGQARSPLLTHVGSTLDGLTIIRSRKAEKTVSSQFDALQDVHTSAWYLYLAANRAFAFWLDIVCVIYFTSVVLSFVLFNDDILVSDVGLAITQCFGLVYAMEWGLRQSAEAENCLISVKRIDEYSKIDTEGPYRSNGGRPSIEGWPRRGSVEFVNVYLRYGRGLPWILKGLSFSIAPGQKVGIVGRTGSGKSSVALALLRLVEFDGSILIDGVDIGVLGLHDFRPRITVIPQDPSLFSGTIRFNLDPLDEYDDAHLWDALAEVEMAGFIKEQEGGLDMIVVDRGANLSTGQKQLLCLARGVLRSNKIIVLDEATANVDSRTESIIQKTMKNKFISATVITIAHRLKTITNSDVIVVMDSGRIKQIGSPEQLLLDTDGLFYSLVNDVERD